MKLICSIAPNADGFVLAHFGAKEYEFTQDESGELTCEVDSEEHAKHLLSTGNFYPHDESDYDAATSILSGSDDDLEEDELDVDPNAAPLEALTPNKPKK